jgi:hypothetical protein
MLGQFRPGYDMLDKLGKVSPCLVTLVLVITG